MNLEFDVRNMLADLMEGEAGIINDINVDDNLFEAGLNSLMAINLVLIIEENIILSSKMMIWFSRSMARFRRL